MTAGATERLEIRIPGRLRYLPAVRDLVREALADGADVDVDGLLLAVQEACVNAIRHGHGGECALPIDVTLTAAPDRVEVRVVDQGQGFELPELEFPESGSTEENGRGLGIIRAVVDEMTVERGRDGTILRLLKLRGTA